jgi:hypothetical protein
MAIAIRMKWQCYVLGRPANIVLGLCVYRRVISLMHNFRDMLHIGNYLLMGR